MKSKENGNYAMTTQPRNKYHLQVSINHPTNTLDKTQTEKPCVKGTAQSGLCASTTSFVLLLCHFCSGVPSQLWSAQANRDLLATVFRCYRCPVRNIVVGTDFSERFRHIEGPLALFFFLTPKGRYFWPRLGLVYTLSSSQPTVAILKLSQSLSQENYHRTYVTSHTYTAQKAKLCSDVSNGSYSCITQHVQFIKTDISSAAKGNNKLQSMQTEELTALTVVTPFSGHKTNIFLAPQNL